MKALGWKRSVLAVAAVVLAATLAEAVPAAAAPLSPVLEATGTSSVRLSWTAVAGATRYKYQVQRCDGTVVVDSDTQATSKTGLAAGCYRGRVKAKVSGSFGPWELSNEVTLGSPPPPPPPPPGGLPAGCSWTSG